MQYASVDAEGRATGFYDDAVHDKMPIGTVALTPALYQQWIADTPHLAWQDGKLVPVDAKVIETGDKLPAFHRAALAALQASDWVVVRSYELGAAMPDGWREYRAALRVAAKAEAVTDFPTPPIGAAK